MHKFRLYIAGGTPMSVEAARNLRGTLDGQLNSQYSLEIIDILDNVQAAQDAEDNGIIATPTLVRIFPLPVEKVIGEVSRGEKVRALLGPGDTETKGI